jgi:hypothetical protein
MSADKAPSRMFVTGFGPVVKIFFLKTSYCKLEYQADSVKIDECFAPWGRSIPYLCYNIRYKSDFLDFFGNHTERYKGATTLYK